MKQRIVISGRGGQGILTLTRVLAEAAALAGHEVITTETHGMAQRGGSVLSTVKVGAFRGPLIGSGEAEVALFLHADNVPVHGHYLRPGGLALVNAATRLPQPTVDADSIAAKAGEPRAANLALLGCAVTKHMLFGEAALFEGAIRATTPPKYLERNLAAFHAGIEAGR